MAEQKDSLLVKLDQLEARYSEIEKQIAEPEINRDSARLIALSKEQGKHKAIVTKYRQYTKAVAGIEEAEQILSDDTADEDFRTLAKEEMRQLEGKKTGLLEEITNSMVMADDLHIDAVIMEIRAGTGGEEAALFARDLYGMYPRHAEGRRGEGAHRGAGEGREESRPPPRGWCSAAPARAPPGGRTSTRSAAPSSSNTSLPAS